MRFPDLHKADRDVGTFHGWAHWPTFDGRMFQAMSFFNFYPPILPTSMMGFDASLGLSSFRALRVRLSVLAFPILG